MDNLKYVQLIENATWELTNCNLNDLKELRLKDFRITYTFQPTKLTSLCHNLNFICSNVHSRFFIQFPTINGVYFRFIPK